NANAPGEDAASVTRGRSIFTSNEASCSSCHIEDTHFTDHESHPLSKQPLGEEKSANARPPMFDTPSLAYVGQTAPYFHDGRFKTLEDLIDGCDGVMGHTKQLSRAERQDLAAYLRSL